MQLTQVVDSISKPYGGVHHQSWTLAGLSCAGEQGAIILEKMRVLMAIESLGGEVHLRKGT